MTDTLWSDTSEWNCPVNDTYPYGFFVFRSNDGSYNDHNFAANLSWTRRARTAGKLWGFGVYYFYRPGFDGASRLISRVGAVDPHMVVMIDVESDRGNVSGDQSAQINREHGVLAKWAGSAKRVIGYGNVSDLNSLWPRKPAGIRLVIAGYGSNPAYPGKFAHQFTDSAPTPPFGPSDLNSADGMSVNALQTMFGYATPAPVPVAPAGPVRHEVAAGNTKTLADIARARNTSAQELIDVTRPLLNAQHRVIFDAYIALNAALRADSHPTAPMPEGLVYWTRKP